MSLTLPNDDEIETDEELAADREAAYEACYQEECDETDGINRGRSRGFTSEPREYEDNDQERRDFEVEERW